MHVWSNGQSGILHISEELELLEVSVVAVVLLINILLISLVIILLLFTDESDTLAKINCELVVIIPIINKNAIMVPTTFVFILYSINTFILKNFSKLD
jgi:hypothetical protein